jgi:NADH-quinone oxidoreductase subunit C
MNIDALSQQLADAFGSKLISNDIAYGEVTIEVAPADLLSVCQALRDTDSLGFEQLIDVCGVDYSAYRNSEWTTDESSSTGFSRGVEPAAGARLKFGDEADFLHTDGKRFASVYHMMSISNNHRLRVRVYCEDNTMPVVPSVIDIWPSANWFEREAFDLYGIIYDGHPDLRRILTDYGFVGHPFRKDFPLVGHVEMIYDEEQKRVVYQPVSIEPRVLVPRVIRDDGHFGAASDEAEVPENTDA